MRVIAGEARGFRLKAPAGMRTRPMADKIKGAIKQMAEDPNATRIDPRTNQPGKLLGIYRWDGVAEAKDSDYQPIRDVAKGLGIPLKELAPK